MASLNYNFLGNKTCIELDNAFRNVWSEKINNISIQIEEDELVVKMNKDNQIIVEHYDSSRVKENIKQKVKHSENIDDWSIVSYFSKEKEIDIDEALSFFLSLWNSLKISLKIKVSI